MDSCRCRCITILGKIRTPYNTVYGAETWNSHVLGYTDEKKPTKLFTCDSSTFLRAHEALGGYAHGGV